MIDNTLYYSTDKKGERGVISIVLVLNTIQLDRVGKGSGYIRSLPIAIPTFRRLLNSTTV